MPAPFPFLDPNNNHLQGPQNAMKAIYEKHPTGFLLPIVKDAPLRMEVTPGPPVANPAERKVTECFSNAEFHELFRNPRARSQIYKHIITLHIKLTTWPGIHTLTPSLESQAQRAKLEKQLASDLRKLAHIILCGYLSALKYLICHVDRTPSPERDADPSPLQVDKDYFFRLGRELESYRGFQAFYSEEEDYYLVVARKYPPVMDTS